MRIVVAKDTLKKSQSGLVWVSKLPFDQTEYQFKVNSQQVNIKYPLQKVKCHSVQVISIQIGPLNYLKTSERLARAMEELKVMLGISKIINQYQENLLNPQT